MKSAGRPIIAALRGRGYAAQAAQVRAPSANLAAQEPRITRLPSGTIVASLENYSPVSRVAVLYNAGSRVEDGTNLGITHTLRNAINISTQNQTNFGVVRNIQQIGGSLSCTTTREHMVYSVECVRSGLDTGLDYLAEVASSPDFKHYEVPDLNARLNLDLAVVGDNPQVRLIEALHQAAFRSSLGRSLYINPKRVGSYDGDALSAFVQNFYTGGNMAVVGLGVDHDQLVFAAKKLKVGQGASNLEAAKYAGGEIRIDEPGALSTAAIVTQGVGITSADALTLGVLQHAMGTGPYVKYGSNTSTSKVGQAVAGAARGPFAASCINAMYSDAGLFGFQVVSQAEDMSAALKSLVGAFSEATKGALTDADVQRGKNQLRSAALMMAENGSDMLEGMGIEAIVTGAVTSPADFEAQINKITTADVQAVAKKVINAGKPTMVAVGNLSNTPYLDELL